MSITEETLTDSTGLDRRTALIALISAVSLAPSAVLAQSAVAPAAAAAVLSPTQFRTIVLMTGGFAMQTSQVALERSRNPGVQEFAQLEINEQMALAAALGASPGSTPLRPDHAQMLQQLQSMTGRNFDRMYVQGQIIGHNEALALTSAYAQSYAQSGFDTQGRSVATLAVPSIQTHLTILSRLRA